MNKVLELISEWHRTNAPILYNGLLPGVHENEIHEIESACDLCLPNTLKDLFRWHNGSSKRMFGLDFGGLPIPERICPGIDILELHAESHPRRAIRTSFRPDGWVDMLHDGGGNFVAIDLNPAEAGTVGQVITYGRDESVRFVIAENVIEFAEEYYRRLIEGRFVILNELKSSESVFLKDSDGEIVDTFTYLAEIFPGFGSSPRT